MGKQQMDKTTATLGTEDVGRLLLNYSTPAIIGTLVSSLYNITDRIFIGHGVGALAISGLTLTLPISALVAAIGTLVGVGAAARMSIVLGMKDVKWARNILGNAFMLTFVFSAILITLSLLFLDDILLAFGGSEQTIPYAKEYLRIVIPGSVLSNLSWSLSGIMRSAGFPRKAMMVLVIGLGLNIILDPLFIFGFGMGIRGAAVATVISMGISAVFAISHFFNRKHTIHFVKGCLKPKTYIIRNITSIGMAPFLMNAAASAVNMIMNNQLARHGGDLAIGAYGIINSYGILIVMTVMGLCQGMQPIVGYNYGAMKIKRMKDTLLLTIKIATIIMLAGTTVCLIFPRQLAMAFTNDEELIGMVTHGMRIFFAMGPVVGFQVVISNFFMSISKASQAIFMSLSRQVLFLIPSLYIFSGLFGLTGVWLSVPFSDLLAAIVATMFIIREKRVFYPR